MSGAFLVATGEDADMGAEDGRTEAAGGGGGSVGGGECDGEGWLAGWMRVERSKMSSTSRSCSSFFCKVFSWSSSVSFDGRWGEFGGY